MEHSEIKAVVEALIFAADQPITLATLKKQFADQLNGVNLDSVIDELNEDYQSSGRAFTITTVAGGYQMITRPEYASWIKQMYHGRTKNKLSQAALEALAIIAFKQPISKAEVAAIRGVNSDGVIKNLLEKRLISISGRAEGLGRPLLYSTTREFLEYFGINDIQELPKPREIEELFKEGKFKDEIIEVLAETPEDEVPGDEASGNEETEAQQPVKAGDDDRTENPSE